MIEFEFQLFCRDVDTSVESFLDQLYEAGCDDAVVFFKDGYICLAFTRSAPSAEVAIISAIKNFEAAKTGGSVVRVEPEDLTSLSEISKRVGVSRASLQKYARGDSKIGKDFPRPAANISQSRRELYSAAAVMQWMCAKNKCELPDHIVELAIAIDRTNQALVLGKAQRDDDVCRLLAQLAA